MCLLDIEVAEVLGAVERRLAAGGDRACLTAARTSLIARLARLRVALGFVFGALVLWLAQPTRRSLAVGMSIAACRRGDPDLGRRAPQQVARGHRRRARIAGSRIRCTSGRR